MTLQSACIAPSTWMATATTCSPVPCLAPLPAPTFEPLGGPYTEPKQVVISCTVEGADIRYTMDGSDPTATSTSYSRSVDVTAPLTLRAKAFKTGWSPSPVSSATYSFTCAAIVFDPPAASYGSAQTVRIASSPGATIHYTTNGSTPTAASPAYSTPIAVTASMTIRALATRTGWTDSPAATAAYAIVNLVETPIFSPGAGTYTQPQLVAIACSTEAAEIRYTTNGAEPTVTSTLYSTPIELSAPVTIRAKAFKTDWTASSIASAAYTFTCAKPTFTPDGGTFGTPLSVTIASMTPGVTIRLTTDGTTPTGTSPAYSGAIAVSSDTTLRAIATRTSWADSPIATAVYTGQRVPTPTLDPPEGAYPTARQVSISCAMTETVIRYTLNGSEPNSESPLYATPVTVSENRTLRARAFRPGWLPSRTATGHYVIGLFYDFEGWNGNFFPQSGWQWGTPAQLTPYSGSQLWAMSLSGNYTVTAPYVLLTPSLRLSEGATLSFWHRYAMAQYNAHNGPARSDVASLYISADNDSTWTQLTSDQGNEDFRWTQNSWAFVSYNLQSYANRTVRVKFDVWASSDHDYYGNIGWFVDDVQITKATEVIGRAARP